MTKQNVPPNGAESKIVPVMFGSDLILAAQAEDEVFVAIKPIAESLGLAWNKQLERIKRDTILAEGMTMMVMPLSGHGQETVCLRLDLVNGWLFGIDEKRVRPEVRPTVLRYKRECYRVLFQHFYPAAPEFAGTSQVHHDVLPPIGDQVQDIGLNLRIVTETRQSFGCKSSQQMWFKLGLPTVPAMYEAGGQMALPFSRAAE